VPFLSASAHEGGEQVPRQTRETQSSAIRHEAPSMQAAQEPPQSASVSEPFMTLSMQDGGAHDCESQTSDAQSAFSEHPAESGHGGQVPPQSVDVSVPLRVPFAHDPVRQ
jgi:hypothetical protein